MERHPEASALCICQGFILYIFASLSHRRPKEQHFCPKQALLSGFYTLGTWALQRTQTQLSLLECLSG